MNTEIKYPRRLLIRKFIRQLSKAAFFLLSDFQIIGEENLPNSSETNLKACLRILEEMAEEKGLDYIKENKLLIIDQIEKTDNMF